MFGQPDNWKRRWFWSVDPSHACLGWVESGCVTSSLKSSRRLKALRLHCRSLSKGPTTERSLITDSHGLQALHSLWKLGEGGLRMRPKTSVESRLSSNFTRGCWGKGKRDFLKSRTTLIESQTQRDGDFNLLIWRQSMSGANYLISSDYREGCIRDSALSHLHHNPGVRRAFFLLLSWK